MKAPSVVLLIPSPRREVTLAIVTLWLAASTSYQPSSLAIFRATLAQFLSASHTSYPRSPSPWATGSYLTTSRLRFQTSRESDRLLSHFMDMILGPCVIGTKNFKLYKRSQPPHTSSVSKKTVLNWKCIKTLLMPLSWVLLLSLKVNLPLWIPMSQSNNTFTFTILSFSRTLSTLHYSIETWLLLISSLASLRPTTTWKDCSSLELSTFPISIISQLAWSISKDIAWSVSQSFQVFLTIAIWVVWQSMVLLMIRKLLHRPSNSTRRCSR